VRALLPVAKHIHRPHHRAPCYAFYISAAPRCFILAHERSGRRAARRWLLQNCRLVYRNRLENAYTLQHARHNMLPCGRDYAQLSGSYLPGIDRTYKALRGRAMAKTRLGAPAWRVRG